jgi:hypothetical protein
LFKKYTALGVFFFMGGSLLAQSSVQEMNTDVSIGDLSVTVRLEARDIACSKKKQIEINKMFCMAAMITSAKGAAIKDLKLTSFDATMPEHRHGMVTRAKIKALNSGEYLIEGLKLHMPGEWKISFELVHGNKSAQVAIPLKL